MQRPALWVKLPSVARGAARRGVHLSIWESSSLQPPPGPERCCWCGCGAVEQPSCDSFRQRTLLIVYLSAGAFHHFWCLRASCFQKAGQSYAPQSSPAYFMLLRIRDTGNFGWWSASQVFGFRNYDNTNKCSW